MRNELSRRTFLKGAAASAAGVAAMSMAPVMADEEMPAEEMAAPMHSWEIAPDPVDESEIVNTVETEVLIIGAGYSGLAAAASSAERGVDVIVLEKNMNVTGHGVGGTGSVGSKIIDEIAASGDETVIMDKPYSVVQWLRACANRCRESFVAKFFNESHRAMDWLIDLAEADGGVVFLSACNSRSRNYPEQPAYHMVAGIHSADGLEGLEALSLGVPLMLKNHAEANGAQVQFGVKAEYLEKDADGRVTGAICSTEEGYVRYNASLGVVLATGDIAANDEMMDYFAPIGQKVYAKLYTPVDANMGEGHMMGLWAGGSFQDGPWPTMMHPQACAGFHGPFLFVSPEGKRFMDEATWVQGKCLGIILQAKSSYAWSIFDSHWKEDLLDSLPHGGGMFWDTFRFWGSSEQDAVDAFQPAVENPDDMFYFSADTLEELAEKIGVPVEEFMATVERYNEMCANGEDVDFYKEAQFLYPVQEGPFYATKIGTGLLTVVGGLNVSDNFECLTAEGEVIPGLYATGNCSGNLYASDYPINIPGNSHGRCLTWGYLLGEQFEAMKAGM